MSIQTTQITFAEGTTLKSGNVRLTTDAGTVYYTTGLVPKLGVPLNVEFHSEERSGKLVSIIDSVHVIETPSLPKTTVTETAAPGGESPVKAAKKETVKASYGGGDYQKPWLPEEAHRVAILNILTAVLQSPGYAQECVGRNSEEVDAVFARGFAKAVALYNRSKAVE